MLISADTAKFEAALDGLAGRARAPIVRIESFEGELLFAGARGTTRPGTDAPATSETPFHLASVTKTMTAVALMQLWERGALPNAGLDAPILSVLADDLAAALTATAMGRGDEAISLRQLMTHTSGIRDGLEDDAEAIGGPAQNSLVGQMLSGQIAPERSWRSWDGDHPRDPMAGVLNFFINAKVADHPVGRPGERFHYSDTGYLLLALAVEKLSGRPIHQFWRANLFDPLGMDRTYLAYGERPAQPDGFTGEEAELWLGDRPFLSRGFNLSFDWGGGGLVSTAADLIAFMRGLMSGQLVRLKTLAQMTAWISPPGMPAPRAGVGLGLDRLAYPGLELWGRTGSWGVRMMYEPKSRLLLAGTLNMIGEPRAWHADLIRLALEGPRR